MDNFIRWKTVDILKYLPFFITKDELFKTTNDADSREHERIRVKLLKILVQLNIQNATDGIKLWDTFIGIDTSADGIDVRRARIIERLNHNSSSTKEFLEYIANQFQMNPQEYLYSMSIMRWILNLIRKCVLI